MLVLSCGLKVRVWFHGITVVLVQNQRGVLVPPGLVLDALLLQSESVCLDHVWFEF